MRRSTIHFLLVFALAVGIGLGQSVIEFRAVDPIGRNTVQFKTAAPLEDIVGTTNRIEGTIKVDPKNPKSVATWARFEVDLAGLNTGIGLRDTHMREQYLHTDKYPKAVFTLERIRKVSASELTPNKRLDAIAEGSFELHGIKIEVPVNVTSLPESPSTMGKLPGNLLRITAEFDIRLADYNIERPQMVLLKVGEMAHVSLDVFATDASEQKMAMWMEQMKKMMGSSG